MNYEIESMGPKSIIDVIDASNTTEKALVISLLVPFFFMIFMSFSMDRVWSLYLML